MPDESFDIDFLNQVAEKGVIVLSLWSLEIGNVLLIAERKQRITLEQRQKALHILTELPITVDTMTAEVAPKIRTVC
jgi:hypothetical protein